MNLYMYKDGKESKVGNSYGLDKNFKDLTRDQASISLGPVKVTVKINQLKYGDYYNFTCQAIGQNADFSKRDIKYKTIVIDHIKGINLNQK